MPPLVDFHNLHGKLSMGAHPRAGVDYADLGFDVLVLCAGEIPFKREAFPGIEILLAPMEDGADMFSIAVAQEAASKVARHLRAGRSVLVTCKHGDNRSGFVCALALRDLLGWTGKQCIDLIRTRRPSPGFNNPSFLDWVKALDRNKR